MDKDPEQLIFIEYMKLQRVDIGVIIPPSLDKQSLFHKHNASLGCNPTFSARVFHVQNTRNMLLFTLFWNCMLKGKLQTKKIILVFKLISCKFQTNVLI